MLLNKEIPVMLDMANGKTIIGKVLEMRVTGENTPFGRACLIMEDVATWQTGRHPKDPGQIVYSLLQWQTQDNYIPWDKVLSFAVANDMAQEYYRQVYARVQVADINEVKAMTRNPEGTKVVIRTP